MKYDIIILLLLIGCNTNLKSRNSEDLNNKRSIQDTFKSYGVKKDSIIQKLVAQIENSNCVYIGGNSIAGEDNEVYICYQNLLEIASNSLWIKLSSSKSAVMRFYAYRILLEKKPKGFEAIKERLKKDTTNICWYLDDVHLNGSIGYFVSILK